ncbi:hypothetical protein [Mycobacteroides abscessus]|uniref:hypothetical protein n=1 Tax=Mycobacteroides abscessus TaxID=36809 RepID=UPI0010423278|nr:hypothetical protein [Mycobacteroides abscessus]
MTAVTAVRGAIARGAVVADLGAVRAVRALRCGRVLMPDGLAGCDVVASVDPLARRPIADVLARLQPGDRLIAGAARAMHGVGRHLIELAAVTAVVAMPASFVSTCWAATSGRGQVRDDVAGVGFLPPRAVLDPVEQLNPAIDR